MTRRPWTEAEILDLLSTRDSHSAAGRRHGRSPEAVRRIRLGQDRADVHPDVPRWVQGVSCERCIWWLPSERCDLGFPDPLEPDVGVAFAMDCSSYREAA